MAEIIITKVMAERAIAAYGNSSVNGNKIIVTLAQAWLSHEEQVGELRKDGSDMISGLLSQIECHRVDNAALRARLQDNQSLIDGMAFELSNNLRDMSALNVRLQEAEAQRDAARVECESLTNILWRDAE